MIDLDFMSWEQRVELLLTLLSNPANLLRDLANIPTDGDPTERLAALNKLRTRLNIPDGELHQSAACGRMFRHITEAQGPAVEAAITALSFSITAEVARLLELGVSDPELPQISTADFGGHFHAKETETPNVLLIFGLVNALPVDHKLRTVLPPDDYYISNGERAILLGFGFGKLGFLSTLPIHRRPFYPLWPALQMTRQWRQHQRLQAEDVQREVAAREAAAVAEATEKHANKKRLGLI